MQSKILRLRHSVINKFPMTKNYRNLTEDTP